MKAIGYARVSSECQIDGTSLTSQGEQIRAYAQMKGIELVDVLIDAGVSGGTPLSIRPQGSAMMEMIQSGEVQAVIITKLDRGFRSTVDCLQTVQVWEKLGVALHIVDMGGNSVDTTSPAGRFMLTVLVAAAEMERGRIRERCIEGRRARKSQGFTTGPAPFGHDVDEFGKLVKNEQEQRAIRIVNELRDEGFSAAAIARRLNDMGIGTKGKSKWTHVQVTRILRRAA
jgi:site-specific DNA recombinase